MMENEPTPLRLAPSVERLKTDAERAAEIRASCEEPLRALCAVMTQARNDGLVVNMNIAPDAYGRLIGAVNIVKAF